MNSQKITPKDRKKIVARVKSGEKQTDVARDYGITQGYLSKIVKQSKEKASSDVSASVPQIDMSRFTTEQLRNRYRQVHLELLDYNEKLKRRNLDVDDLKQEIERESAKAEGVRDEGWILALRKRLTAYEDTTRTAYEMARLYKECSVILHTFAKRGEVAPVSTLLPGIVRGRN